MKKLFYIKNKNTLQFILIVIILSLMFVLFSCKPQALTTVYYKHIFDDSYIIVDRGFYLHEKYVVNKYMNKLNVINLGIHKYDCDSITWQFEDDVIKTKINCKEGTLIPVDLNILNQVNKKGRIIIKNRDRNKLIQN